MTNSLNHARFEEALDLYGPEIDLWPQELRAPARALLEADVEARRMHAQAGRVKALLARAVEPLPLGADRLGRIIAGVEKRRARSLNPLLAFASPRAAFGVTLAFAVVFGLGAVSGTYFGNPAPDEVELAALSVDEVAILVGDF